MIAFDEDPHLSLDDTFFDDTSQTPLSLEAYNHFQKEFTSLTKIRARHAEVNLSSIHDLISAGFHDISGRFGNLQISVNESPDTFRCTIEAHETRINRHDLEIDELRSQNDQHERDIADLRRSTHSQLQYLYRGLQSKISQCDHYKGRLAAVEAQIEELQKAGRRTRAQLPRKKSRQSGGLR